MFEKLEEEIEVKADEYALEESTACDYGKSSKHVYQGYFYGFKKGAEFGYNKANEEAMMKLKDEGIVKPLKDSILRNERLSSQEQQELCAWIECAMDFGENLDECAKELEEAKKANEWHYMKDELPPENVPLNIITFDKNKKRRLWEGEYKGGNGEWWTGYFNHYIDVPYAWKEIVLPELKESE